MHQFFSSSLTRANDNKYRLFKGNTQYKTFETYILYFCYFVCMFIDFSKHVLNITPYFYEINILLICFIAYINKEKYLSMYFRNMYLLPELVFYQTFQNTIQKQAELNDVQTSQQMISNTLTKLTA